MKKDEVLVEMVISGSPFSVLMEKSTAEWLTNYYLQYLNKKEPKNVVYFTDKSLVLNLKNVSAISIVKRPNILEFTRTTLN